MPVGLGAKRTLTRSISLASLQKADGLGGYTLAPARKPQALGGGTAHADPRGFDVEGARQVLAHGLPVVPYLRPLADHNRVHVGDGPGVSNERPRLAQELYGVGVPVTLVGIGEVVADIFESGGPEQGVSNGVGEDVSIGVAEETPLEGDLHAAEDELAGSFHRGEGVSVNAQTHPETQLCTPRWAASRAASIASASTRSSGEVSLMLVFSPATITTRPPASSTRDASSVAARRSSSGAA